MFNEVFLINSQQMLLQLKLVMKQNHGDLRVSEENHPNRSAAPRANIFKPSP